MRVLVDLAQPQIQKMMKKIKAQLLKLSLGLTAILFAASCSTDKDDIDIPQDSQLTQSELQAIVETDYIASSIDSTLAQMFYQGGQSAKSDEECYTVAHTNTGFTATFNNCVLNGTDNMNGTVTITYVGDEENAEFSAVYTDFYVGDIKVNGTRTFEVTIDQNEQISYTTTSDLTIEMADGTIVSENGTKTSALVFEEGEDTLWNISGSWTIEKDGNTYSISGDISRQLNCAYWTSGTMTVNKNGLAIDVDFGDGTCDNKATVTYPNGSSEEISL